MERARGRQSDTLSPLRMGLGERGDGLGGDIPGLHEEADTEIPPLVSAQGRGPSQPMSMTHSQGITAGMRNLSLMSSMLKGRQQGSVQKSQSLDVEGLFDMEDMVDTNVIPFQMPSHSDEEEDSDDSLLGEGVHIPGSHDGVRDLAKSVPVNVPMWAAARAKPAPDPCIVERPSDINQMGASIKALARSVHTTSVDLFGDLPRPRQPL